MGNELVSQQKQQCDEIVNIIHHQIQMHANLFHHCINSTSTSINLHHINFATAFSS